MSGNSMQNNFVNMNALKKSYFGSPIKSVITFFFLFILIWLVPKIFDWMLLSATFIGDAELCAQNGGACWSFIDTKLNLILFGAYPPEILWRPIVFLIMVVAVAVYGFFNVRRYALVIVLWSASGVIGFVLMRGGFFGMELVDRARWGGLPITILITIGGLFSAFPIGVLLALGRQSKRSFISIPCKIYIDIVFRRSVEIEICSFYG